MIVLLDVGIFYLDDKQAIVSTYPQLLFRILKKGIDILGSSIFLPVRLCFTFLLGAKDPVYQSGKVSESIFI